MSVAFPRVPEQIIFNNTWSNIRVQIEGSCNNLQVQSNVFKDS